MTEYSIPALSTEQMREVDRLMIEEFGISLVQMMENAGRNLAALARTILDGDVVDQSIIVLAGRGNNGGGGLVAARHLHNWGAWVQLVTTHPSEEYHGVPSQQLAILDAMRVPQTWAEDGWELPPCDLIIDAIIGYGLRGDPQGKAREPIHLANSSQAPILSLDAPSGLDTTNGKLYDPHIHATATMTLALAKVGLLSAQSRGASGDLYLADISVPPELYGRMGIDVGLPFSGKAVVRVRNSNGDSIAEFSIE